MQSRKLYNNLASANSLYDKMSTTRSGYYSKQNTRQFKTTYLRPALHILP